MLCVATELQCRADRPPEFWNILTTEEANSVVNNGNNLDQYCWTNNKEKHTPPLGRKEANIQCDSGRLRNISWKAPPNWFAVSQIVMNFDFRCRNVDGAGYFSDRDVWSHHAAARRSQDH